MYGFVTAKQLILEKDLNVPDSGKPVRHASHEFQAFAYKLAADLNDLIHLPIYLKLCKNVERYILEQAYTYAIDARSENKCRVFLWKVKNIRGEVQKKRNLTNFDYEFVALKMKRLRDKLAGQIVANNDFNIEKEIAIPLQRYFLSENIDKAKALLIGNDSTLVPTLTVAKGMKTLGIDISTKLTNILKESFENHKGVRFMKKDFLSNNFPNESFNLICINKFWQCIPLESEILFLAKLNNVLKENGKVIMGVKVDSEEKQIWKYSMIGGVEEMIFNKTNAKQEHERKLMENGFNILHCFEMEKMNYYMLRKA